MERLVVVLGLMLTGCGADQPMTVEGDLLEAAATNEEYAREGLETAYEDARDAAAVNEENAREGLATAYEDARDAAAINEETLRDDLTIEDGTDGAAGKDGAQGAKGSTGKTGATGERGADGDTGATGSQGAAGENGKDGSDGNDGEDGDDGVDGVDGEDGDDALVYRSLKIPHAYRCISLGGGLYAKNEGSKADIYGNSRCSHRGTVYCDNVYQQETCWVGSKQLSITGTGRSMMLHIVDFRTNNN